MGLTALLSLALALALPAAPPSDCGRAAEALVAKVEALPMMRRARAIELALRKDPRILCGVTDARFFTTSPEAPVGCDRSRPASCSFPRGISVAERLAEDSDPILYLRVQVIATRLRERGVFVPAHERLLSTLLLAARIAAEEHDH